MNIKFNAQDSKQLNDEGYIVLEGKNDKTAPALLLVTMDYLQTLADGFAAGLSVKIGKVSIAPVAENALECPACKAKETN